MWIDDAALSSAVDEGAEEARRQKPTLRLPLKFDDLTQEVSGAQELPETAGYEDGGMF